MKERKDALERKYGSGKAKAMMMMVLAVIIASSFIVYAITSGNIGYSLVLLVIATVLLVVFGLFAIRRYRDAEKGLPFEDERSRKVMEKATSRSFFVSLYTLLFIGWLSEDIVHFRDVSQATSAVILVLAISFFICWVYYNRKEI
ncbi:MAG: DUF2178 domain-containing protein [Candidatus Thermoplasmatota archaeon]|jgi:uncharacterized membrane protein|nr:DUF2178 domain-containing protein [Candidatus Thermoplasmatota archaeon]